MYVHELRKELEKVDGDVWIDAMFPDGSTVYAITAVSQFDLNDGRTVAVIDIVDDTPLRAV